MCRPIKKDIGIVFYLHLFKQNPIIILHTVSKSFSMAHIPEFGMSFPGFFWFLKYSLGFACFVKLKERWTAIVRKLNIKRFSFGNTLLS